MDILLIVDMQESPFSKPDKYDSDAVISRINRLAEHVRKNGGQVIFIQHDGTKEEGLFPSTPGWEILSTMTRYDADIVIRKTTNDGFYNTHLQDYMVEKDTDTVFVVGWATDFCVDTTIRSAISHGYKITVIADAHTLSDRPHLPAQKIIEHHNWVWGNMIAPRGSVKVITLNTLLNCIP
ncbi:MAG: nicotinamidase-related amidase [Gammaproteobacteria bacterium]|jgi:nicotinamidase-related amidase